MRCSGGPSICPVRPDRQGPARQDQATPYFALQLRNRIAKLIAGLPAGHPARLEGEREIARLQSLGLTGEVRGEGRPRASAPCRRYGSDALAPAQLEHALAARVFEARPQEPVEQPERHVDDHRGEHEHAAAGAEREEDERDRAMEQRGRHPGQQHGVGAVARAVLVDRELEGAEEHRAQAGEQRPGGAGGEPTIVPIAPTRISSSEKGHGARRVRTLADPAGIAPGAVGAREVPVAAPRVRRAVTVPAGRPAGAVAGGSGASVVPAPPERRLRGRPRLPEFRFVTDQPGGSSRHGMAVDRSAYAQRQMSLQSSPDEARPAGIPDSPLPGPFGVGRYAAKLRGELRSFARVR